MPSFGQYQIWLLDWYGEKVNSLFPGNDFLSITWQHKRNQAGVYRCELVGETDTKGLFRKHYQILIERNWGADPADWYEEYSGFHLGYQERWPTGDVDEHYWVSTGLSPEWLVSQPLVWPKKRLAEIWDDPLYCASGSDWIPCPTPIGKRLTNAAIYEKWWAYGAADDLVKLMASESMAGGADEGRQISPFAVQGDRTEGTYLDAEGEWTRLSDTILDTIGEDGARGNCDYRVERIAGGYELRTYVPCFGTDRRRGNPYGNKPVIFSHENQNVQNLVHHVSWAEQVTLAFGGWQGQGDQRDVTAVFDAAAYGETPYSKREAFYELRELSSQDTVETHLQQKLIDDGEAEMVGAVILQTDACLYGRDWWFGDLVTLDLPDGSSYDMRVIETAGRLSGDNEEQIEGVIELWNR